MQLFFETVRTINRRDYTQEQVEAWASPPQSQDVARWEARQETRTVFVAEEAGTLCGFAEWEPNGHIDCFYVHKDWQGKGVGSQLMEAIFALAREQQCEHLLVEVSLTAHGFFERKGFQTLFKQEVIVRGVSLSNYKMELHLPCLSNSPPKEV
jgi:GNAT superfamily N-acetyltransferase